MASLAERYNLESYKVKGVTAVLTPLAEGVFGPTRPALLALLGGTGLVLLVACANVAALQIVQLSERASEMALRAALGASRARIARGLLAESLVLGLVGGLLGVAGAAALVPLLVAIAPGDVPRLADAALDREALLVAVALTLLTALATALGPILALERRSLREALAGGSRVTPGGSRLRAGWWRRKWDLRWWCSWAQACCCAASWRCATCRSATTRRACWRWKRGRPKTATRSRSGSGSTWTRSSRGCGHCPASNPPRP